MEFILKVLESEVAINAIYGLCAIIIAHFVTRSNKVSKAVAFAKKYKGVAISGVRRAEKEIDDDVKNAYIHKFDNALKFTLNVIERVEGKPLTTDAKTDVEALVHEAHAIVKS